MIKKSSEINVSRDKGSDEIVKALQLFRTLIDHTNDTIEVIDPETGRFLDVNKSTCRAHGYSQEEYLSLSVPDVDPTISKDRWHELKEDIQRAGFIVYERMHRRKDGSFFPVEVNVTSICLNRDYMLAIVRDITERKRMQEALTQRTELLGKQAVELREANERLKQLSRHILEAQEKERRAIARELHDDVAQNLAYIQIALSQLPRHVNDKESRKLVRESINGLDAVTETISNMALTLRPATLDELGFIPALDLLVKEQARRINCRAHFTVNPLKLKLKTEIDTTCYRVTQEALNNVRRHAKAQNIYVTLQGNKGDLLLTIKDDGKGFDVNKAQRKAGLREKNFGLIGMRERVELAGGLLEIRSCPGEGTIVKAMFQNTKR